MTTEQRIEKLEHELSTAKRRNRWILGAAFLVLVAVGSGYKNTSDRTISGTQDEAKARRFVVVDAEGNKRASLSVLSSGSSLLVMNDVQGK